MNRFLRGCAVLGVVASLGLIGCEKKSTVTTEKKVTSPGGTTTTIDEKTIKQSGDNPPPANGAQPVTPNEVK
jgi:hypothetical protein